MRTGDGEGLPRGAQDPKLGSWKFERDEQNGERRWVRHASGLACWMAKRGDVEHEESQSGSPNSSTTLRSGKRECA